ncbi:AAA family ATPase [Nocardia xishanensis]|uniref:ParA family protein n=1 Tax=Nocardia xishanensis TaxID=238964 RepID=UPI0033C2FB1B
MSDVESGRIVAIANQKGGVGKTVSEICLARAAQHDFGAKVLVVDMDPQGNLTTALSQDPIASDDVTVADAISPGSGVLLREVIVSTIWEGIDLAPGGGNLSVADQKLSAAQWGREHGLREALAPVAGDYDLVLIDNAPSLLGQLLINSLTAAGKVVLVTEADTWSNNGLAQLGRTIAGVRAYHNPSLEIVGTVVNKWQGTTLNKDSAEDLTTGMAKHFPGVPVWDDAKIPHWTGIKTSIDNGVPLDQSRTTKLRVLAADVYRPLAGRLLGVAA